MALSAVLWGVGVPKRIEKPGRGPGLREEVRTDEGHNGPGPGISCSLERILREKEERAAEVARRVKGAAGSHQPPLLSRAGQRNAILGSDERNEGRKRLRLVLGRASLQSEEETH